MIRRRHLRVARSQRSVAPKLDGAVSSSGHRARVFLSYKQSVEPDVAFTHMLAKTLTAAGCEVVWDQEILPSRDWRDKLEDYIKGCDLFLLVLTHSSAHSPFVQTELEYAFKAAHRDPRHPRIAAIRVAYQKQPPMDVHAMLRGGQNLEWNTEEDTLHLLDRLFALLREEGFPVERDSGKEVSQGLFVSQATPFARNIRAALAPFVGDGVTRCEPSDEALFLAHSIDWLYKAVLLKIPPDSFHGTTVREEDEMFHEAGMHLAVLSRYAASTGKPLRLQQSFLDLIDVIDKHLEATRKQRELTKSAQLNLANLQQAHHLQKREEIKEKEFSSIGEAALAALGSHSEFMRLGEQVNLELRGKHLALRGDFNRKFDSAYASTAITLRELAKLYRWDDGEWRFDAQTSTWQEIRKLSFEGKFAERARALRALLDRSPNNFGLIFFYLHNVTAAQGGGEEERLRLAARGALMVPDAYIFDEEREALASLAALAASTIIQQREQGQPFGASNAAFAEAVLSLLKLFEDHNPDLITAGRVRGQVVALAASGKLSEALGLAEQRLRVEPKELGLCYIMARLASRLNRFDDALVWLRQSMKARRIKAVTYRVEPDLQHLNSARPADFWKLTAVNCQVVCDSGMFFYDIILTNNSGFALNALHLIVDIPGGGSKTVSFPGAVQPGGTKKWGWAGQVSHANSATQPSFYLRCTEGETSG